MCFPCTGVRRPLGLAACGLVLAGMLLSGCARVHPLTPSVPPTTPVPVMSETTEPDETAGPLRATPEPATPTPAVTPSLTPPPSPGPTAAPTVAPAQPESPEPTGSAAKVDCAKAKCIALTFDDGPGARSGEVLDVLARKGVKATFFVVGKNVRLHPGMVRRMVDEGHVVGNHSYTHPKFWELDSAAISSEVSRTSAAIQHITGQPVTLLRPPYGQSNDTVHAIEREQGLAQILWSLDSLDWKTRDTEKTIKRVRKLARPGAIVLLHEIHAETRAALPELIDTLQRSGYTLVTVPELLGSTKPGVNYSQRK